LQSDHLVVKISDFGTSFIYLPNDNASESEICKAVGSPAFLAPELCGMSDNLGDNLDAFGIDIWAMGVTLYCLVHGKVPFHGDTEFEVFHSINHCNPIFNESVPETLKDLISRMLDKNPSSRIKLIDIQLHPWIREDLSLEEYQKWIQSTLNECQPSEDVSFIDRVKVGFQKCVDTLYHFFLGNRRRDSTPSMCIF
jgi:serine/threonine protein kinase